MYANEKNKIRLVVVSGVIAGLLTVFTFVMDGTVLYY